MTKQSITKMKQAAYSRGYIAGSKKGEQKGVELGYAQAKARFQAANYMSQTIVPVDPKVERERKREDAHFTALRDICQAGTGVVESMAKALLSVNNNL